jgi:hypothetical protein
MLALAHKNLWCERSDAAIFAVLALWPTDAGCKRALSSVGSEHLVYTERVGGSSPSAPTLCGPRAAVDTMAE